MIKSGDLVCPKDMYYKDEFSHILDGMYKVLGEPPYKVEEIIKNGRLPLVKLEGVSTPMGLNAFKKYTT